MGDSVFNSLRAMKKYFLLLILILHPLLALSATDVAGMRMWTAPDHTRLVFDITAPAQHKIFRLHEPERLVIDFKKSGMKTNPDPKQFKNRHISGLRFSAQKGGDLRIVLDLSQPVRPKSFLLKPNAEYGHRLVVDLYDQLGRVADKPRVVKHSQAIGEGRDVVVAIDAGHGGDDPGAIGGKLKAREKTITLQIARKLKKLIDKQEGMRAILTRNGDYYIGLRKRMRIARKHHADLFVSIHADAFRSPKAHGSSVFILSRRGASSEAARWLAAKENSADMVGGVSLDDKDDVLASVLLDLSQTGTQAASLSSAGRVHREMGKIGKQHGNKKVQQAGFMVLKAPDIPSMLVETGFISNHREERKLASKSYQQKMAKAIFKGVKAYFHAEPPVDSLIAMKKHGAGGNSPKYVIQAGDTLSGIAQRHQVSIAALRRENGLHSDRIRRGQVLQIPKT